MKIKKFIPGPLKTIGKALSPISLIDQIDIWIGERDVLTPPKRLEFVGAGDFKEHGRLFANRFRDIAELNPNTRLLDVGSGVGRIAVGLVNFIFPPNGSYDGIEIVKDGVDWCQKNITKRYPHFRFKHIDIYNKFYNKDGKIQSSAFKFPFDNETFDLVVLTSVFTHMLEKDIVQYLLEIERVLKPGGTVYATMFLLNDESKQLLKEGRSTLPMYPFTTVSQVQDLNMPEMAISFEEVWVKDAIAGAGLVLKDFIRYGSWAGRINYYDYQDTLVLKKY